MRLRNNIHIAKPNQKPNEHRYVKQLNYRIAKTQVARNTPQAGKFRGSFGPPTFQRFYISTTEHQFIISNYFLIGMTNHSIFKKACLMQNGNRS